MAVLSLAAGFEPWMLAKGACFLGGAAVIYLALQLWLQYIKNCQIVSHIPGQRLLIHPHHILSMVLPKVPGVNIGPQYTWEMKRALYDNCEGIDVCSTVSVIPAARTFCVSDAEAIKFIVKERLKFMKPSAIYQALGMFGPNVGITEGSDWTRHRRIVAGPTFAETTIQRAWDETIRVVDLCFEDWRGQILQRENGARDVIVPSGVTLMLKIALFSISGAAFSQYPPWNDDDSAALPTGHTMTFRAALHSCLENVFWKIALPDVAFRYPRIRPIKVAFDELKLYFQEMITERRKASNNDARVNESGQADLLGFLIHSSADEKKVDDIEEEEELTKKRASLSDEEVMGNIYVFLLAGHDTTAHTLAFSLALLALYPDIQQKAFESIGRELDPMTEPVRAFLCIFAPNFDQSYHDFPKLTYILSVFLETLRLYPSVVVIPKYAMEDTLVPVRRRTGDSHKSDSILIPEGGEVFLNAVGLHYDPNHWHDPTNFMPERFIDTAGYQWPRDAFLGFSAGPRSCLGQKYAQIEAVAVLTTILSKYEILLQEDVDGTGPKGETFDEKRERITKCKTVITLTPVKVPFVFRKRRR